MLDKEKPYSTFSSKFLFALIKKFQNYTLMI